MKKILLLITILFIVTNKTFAAQAAYIQKTNLSFEQAYELMLENNNLLKAYNELINKQKYEKKAAIGEFLPKVGLNATYLHFSKDLTLNTNATAMGVPFTASTLIQEQNVFTFGGMAVWNIFTGGKILSNNAAARAKLEAADKKYCEIKGNLTVDLVKRYYGLRLLKDYVAVREEVKNGMEKHLNDAKLLEKEGMISKSERLHADVAFANAKKDYLAATHDAISAEEGLKALIKADKADLSDISIEPVSLLFLYKQSDVNFKEMKENALNNNPQLLQLKAKKKALNAKYHAEMANYSPTVSLLAFDLPATDNLTSAAPRAGFGVSANWLVFDGLAKYNTSQAAKSERKMVEYEIINAEYNIESLITKQYEDLIKYKEQYESLDKSLENATEALRTASLAFKEGLGTSLQVTDAQMMLSKIKIERLKALYDYDVALAELLKTNGNTNDIINFIISPKTAEDK